MMKVYDVRIASFNDAGKIADFIDKHWKKDHALAISQDLLNFQHYNAVKNSYNYIIAINAETEEIDGLIGFISPSHYDEHLANERDYWGAIWKIRTDVSNDEIKTLGLDLFDYFNKYTNFKTFAAIGISLIAKKIYKALRYQIGSLEQYYILNEKIREFKIAEIGHYPKITADNEHANFIIKTIPNLEGIEKLIYAYQPRKSATYMYSRYQKHPLYKYDFFGVYNQSLLVVLFVTRTIMVSGAKVMRIVDIAGQLEMLPNLYQQFQIILNENDLEYIDCVNFGISSNIFKKIGFQQLLPNENNIIPNYFEPFERKNVVIEFAYKSAEPYMIFKGDSDQDRPNIIK